MSRNTVVLLVVAGVLAGCGGSDARGLPDMVVPALSSGDELDVGSLVGPAVINLWATWCVPCTDELPDFQRASADTPDVRFIGIDETGFGEDAASVEFLADLGVTFEQYADTDGAFASEIEVSELPATLVVDAHGDLAWIHQGQVSYDELRDRLADL